jgi:hypothetical protein
MAGMADLARVLDERRACEERDELHAEGHADGYAAASEDVEKIIDGKGTAAAKIKAIRALFNL